MELTFTLFNICMALFKTLLNKLCLKLMHQVQMVMFPFICRKYPTGLESIGYEAFKGNLSGVNYVQETYYSIDFWGWGVQASTVSGPTRGRQRPRPQP